MKFNKEDLVELLDGGSHGDFEEIENNLYDASRWSLIYNLVFKFKDKYYQTEYSVGATESQDESPFEYEPDEIECREVVPTQQTVTVYK